MVRVKEEMETGMVLERKEEKEEKEEKEVDTANTSSSLHLPHHHHHHHQSPHHNQNPPNPRLRSHQYRPRASHPASSESQPWNVNQHAYKSAT